MVAEAEVKKIIKEDVADATCDTGGIRASERVRWGCVGWVDGRGVRRHMHTDLREHAHLQHDRPFDDAAADAKDAGAQAGDPARERIEDGCGGCPLHVVGQERIAGVDTRGVAF